MQICFMGGNQAGIIGLLTILSCGNRVVSGVSYSSELTDILSSFGIPSYDSIKNEGFLGKLKKCDLLVSVHGREIVGPEILRMPRFGCINVHPYLYMYKGVNPIKRAIQDANYKASVGVHYMEKAVDEGEVVIELFSDLPEVKTEDEAYNMLYPYYVKAIYGALEKISREKGNVKNGSF